MQPSIPKKKSPSRLGFIDWTRGLAAAIMLQGHVFNSFTSSDLRQGSAYILSQFVGGMPPAIFLFLTGMTFAFMMDSNERKNMPQWQRFTQALRRSGYLFTLAFAFRFQMFLFGVPDSRWTDLLKVDILNCMGFAMAFMAMMTVFSTTDRIRNCAVLGVVIAAASPLVSALDWSGVPSPIRMYLEPSYNYFAFFPWGSFLAFGLSAGSILRVAKPDNRERLMQWTGLFGLGLILATRYASELPYTLYSNADYWMNGPALIFVKTGVILLMLSFAWVWHTYVIRSRWSWLCQIGTTSLLVYWVHTELVYGRWFWLWQGKLNVAETVIAAVVVILSMVALSVTKTRWHLIRPMLPVRRLRGVEAESD